MKKRKALKILFFIFKVTAVIIALSVQPERLQISQSGHGINALFNILYSELVFNSLTNSLFVIFAICFLFREIFRKNEPFEPLICLLAFFFSLFLLIGDSFSLYHDFTFIFFSRVQTVIAAIILIGKWILLYYGIRYLLHKIDASHITEPIQPDSFVYKHFFSICFFTLLIIWTILSLPYFPGSVPHDGRSQLNQYFRIDPLTMDHPVFATWFLGSIYNIGNIFGTSGGIILIVMVQSFCGAFTFAKICDYIKEQLNLKFASFFLFFYAFAPMWWTYISAAVKDTMFFILIALYSFLICKISDGNNGKKIYFLTTFVSIMLCGFRNNGILIIIVSLFSVFLSLEKKEQRKNILYVLCAVIAVFFSYYFIQVNILGLKTKNKNELIPVPLQQIARYVSQYKDDITEEEAAIIDRIVVYDGIEDRYNPELADPVKNLWRANISHEDFLNFFNLYFQLFKKHPLPFVEAALNHSFGYFDPEYIFEGMRTWQLYNKDSVSANDKGIIYSQYLFSQEIRDISENMADLWKRIPALSIFVYPGAYTWLVMLSITQLLRKNKRKKLCLLVAPAINILICCAFPVNGLLRYALPIMSTMPLYVKLLFSE